MLTVEALIVLELLPIIRRWPSVAAAVSVHLLALGAVLLSPDPRSPTGTTAVDLPRLFFPRAHASSATAASQASSGARTRPHKQFTSVVAPEPAVATAEPVAVEVALSAEASTAVDGTWGDDEGSGTREGIADGMAGADGLAGADGDTDGHGAPPASGRAAASPTEAIRLSSQIESPHLIVGVDPRYPQLARIHGVEGEVVLECIIGADGSVRVKRVLRSIPLLDSAAVEAVEQWRYEPARRDGHPQAVYLSVRVSFRLGS